jgi:hypothetical protein
MGTIWLTDGSTNNKLNHLTIKNASIGLLIQNNDNTTVAIKIPKFTIAVPTVSWRRPQKLMEKIVINKAGWQV